MIGMLDLAVRSNTELAQRGLSAGVVTAERERMTGHTRRIQPQWAKTVGWWGGVKTLVDIAEHVGVEITTAREYAKYRGLRWRTRRRVYTHAQLAVLALATPGTAREVAARLGILPVEACALRSAATEILVENETSLAEVMRWRIDDLEREWRRLGFRIEAPLPDPPGSVTDPEYLKNIVAAAERWLRDHPVEEP